MRVAVATVADIEQAAKIIHAHVSPAPLIRSYRLETELGLPSSRRVWIKDTAGRRLDGSSFSAV